MATISVYTDHFGVERAQKGESFWGFQEPKLNIRNLEYCGFCLHVPITAVRINEDGEIFVMEKERW